jgi:hypothetical protein
MTDAVVRMSPARRPEVDVSSADVGVLFLQTLQ